LGLITFINTKKIILLIMLTENDAKVGALIASMTFLLYEAFKFLLGMIFNILATIAFGVPDFLIMVMFLMVVCITILLFLEINGRLAKIICKRFSKQQ